jgi:hypothetical protein
MYANNHERGKNSMDHKFYDHPVFGALSVGMNGNNTVSSG